MCTCGHPESQHVDGEAECFDLECKCREFEPVCEYCGGTGEVDSMEQVYAGEPHMAPIGTRKCICQVEAEQDRDQDL